MQLLSEMYEVWRLQPNLHVGLHPIKVQAPGTSEQLWKASCPPTRDHGAAFDMVSLHGSLVHADWIQLIGRLQAEVSWP